MIFDQPRPPRPEFSPMSLLRALWKQRVCLLLTWALLSSAAVLVVRRLAAIYRAQAVIVVEAQGLSEKYVTATVDGDLQGRLESIRQQILSYNRLVNIIEEFGLYAEDRSSMTREELVARMRKDIDTPLEKGWGRERPGAFRVAYQGRNPAVVAAVANCLGNLFVEENSRSRQEQAAGASEFMERELREAKKRLEGQEGRLSAYKLQYNGELPQQENTLLAGLSQLQMQLQGVQDGMTRVDQNRLMLENALGSARVTEATLSQMATQMTPAASGAGAAASLLPPKKSEKLKVDLDAMLSRYSPDHPDIRRLQAELARVEKLEESEPAAASGTVEPASSGPLDAASVARLAAAPQMAQTLLRERERVEDLKSQLALAAKQVEAMQSDRRRILDEIAAVRARLAKLPLREQELTAVTRDYEISKTNYQSLLDKKLAANLAASMERNQKTEKFRVLEPARVPEQPIKPDRNLLSAAGCALSLLLATAVALGRELKKDVLLGEWELPPQVYVLGRISHISPPVRSFHADPGR